MTTITLTHNYRLGDVKQYVEIETFQKNQNVMSIQFHKTGVTLQPGESKNIEIPDHLCAVLKTHVLEEKK